ncbi:cyclin-like protein [Lentinula guzmanii]|uniref:Cyclin-like protein n=1 Tax=Lentinula guzmanii TaxID=2804957 RepID=A0AA38J527_9AGAR|nr:cyclin-like protein [Lentinula guzmanii]
MATDFWASSHYTRWIVDRATLKQARADDSAYVPEPEYLDFLTIYFANLITKLGKKLQFRQRVVATATVFFRRFYLKNSYCETDPYLVISACCYVAAKAEESPVHIKNVVTESRSVFGQAPYNVKHFPSDNSKLAEMEFYLVDDLECDLVVFHPYRTLLALCKKDSSMSPGGGNSDMPSQEAEAGELGTGIGAEDGPRFWGTGEGKLELSEVALQTAWFIINDTYRSELCLLYPPHLIAITAIYLTLVLHTPTQNSIAHLLPHSSAFNSDIPIASESPQATPQPRRSSRSSDPSSKQTQQDPISFLADLNVSLSAISTIAQEIISMYSLWNRYKEDPTAEETRNSNMDGPGSGSPASHTSQAGVGQRSGSTPLGNTPGSVGEGGTDDSANQPNNPWPFGQGRVVTAMFLSSMLNSMREARMSDMAHPSSGRPVVVNRMLERTG